ncbi:SDR family oxidoreductase [Candidatus Lokiarchaeum ossiferum]|uniref:SDR family oxidoreductase n=1 Tax=Candidatus Lokiarchaeum ossiferum TaxID=2951803 RepID=UPI00352C5798
MANLTDVKGPVLITGASSGIGFRTTLHLASMGVVVYAGVRKEADKSLFKDTENVIPVIVDITKVDQIEDLVKFIEKQKRGLFGLINNAGVGELGSINEYSDKLIQHHFDVNVFGHMRITRTILPFLKESQGRIVITGSMSGILTSKIMGLYSMSKHAIEAFSNVLRGELAEFNIQVSLIQPGNFKSKVLTSMVSRYKEGIHKEEQNSFIHSERMEKLAEMGEQDADPVQVAKVMEQALFSDKPNARYFVGNKQEAHVMIEGIMTKMLQINQNEHQMTRDELVELLDQLIKDYNEPKPYRYI